MPSAQRRTTGLAGSKEARTAAQRPLQDSSSGRRRFGRGAQRRRAQIRRVRRPRAELDDPEAQDAVRDLQIVVKLLKQLVLAPELDEVVIGLGLLTHFIGRLTGTPVVPADELARAIDEVRDVCHDLLTTLGFNSRVEQQREIVDVLSTRHCGRGW